MPRLAHAVQVDVTDGADAMPVHTADVLAEATVPSLVTAAVFHVGTHAQAAVSRVRTPGLGKRGEGAAAGEEGRGRCDCGERARTLGLRRKGDDVGTEGGRTRTLGLGMKGTDAGTGQEGRGRWDWGGWGEDAGMWVLRCSEVALESRKSPDGWAFSSRASTDGCASQEGRAQTNALCCLRKRLA